jgi:hypothetical protein
VWQSIRRSTLIAVAVAAIAVVGSLAASARAEERYECRIREAYRVTDQGTLEAGAWSGDPQRGRFTVSRESGQVIGDWLTTVRASRTEVTQAGNSEWGYLTLARFQNEHGESIQTIHIQHYHPGPDKPFVASSPGGVGLVSGICQLR